MAEEAAKAQFPLAMASEDDVLHVASIRGDAELRQHLAELGFVEGAEVTVVSHAQGNVIVLVKGARLGLNKAMSTHVMVTP